MRNYYKPQVEISLKDLSALFVGKDHFRSNHKYPDLTYKISCRSIKNTNAYSYFYPEQLNVCCCREADSLPQAGKNRKPSIFSFLICGIKASLWLPFLFTYSLTKWVFQLALLLRNLGPCCIISTGTKR